jgi:regulator of replication initiation timing
VLEIEKKRLTTERDNMASQLGVAFQTCEELKNEKGALSTENDTLRQEIDTLRAENDSLRDQLEQDASQHREETVQLRRQFDQAANSTERENATLHAELARVRAQHDEHTQQLSRKDIELRKARQEQAEYARLKADHESLRSQLANFKAKREEEVKRWTRQESALKSQVDRRDETIRQFQDMTQEQTNEAMRLDNQNLRHELAQLAAQHDDENEQWARKEAELQRKIQRREDAARRTLDMTREVLAMRETNEQPTTSVSRAKGKEDVFDEPSVRRKPSYRREDTRTRIKSRVQQEVRNSRAASTAQQSSHFEESPRKTYTGVSRFSNRSVSAPIQVDKNARVESEVESTTDLSLAPRGTSYTSRSAVSAKQPTIVQPPADLDLTELSCIDSNLIAQLRRTLEEERAAARRQAFSGPVEQQPREDTLRSQRQTREDTVRSVASAKSERRPPLVRKSSLKENTQRTNVTQFEEDVTGNMSNLDADAEATQTKQSAVDISMLSNTSRRRRSAPNEMTSAFIVPDIKLNTVQESTATIEHTQKIISRDHDNANCTVCRRQGLTTTTADFRVPKLVPVSSRMPDDVDATIRPARSPKEALALVVKELQDERFHLHTELAVLRAMLESHDVSLGNRKRRDINASIQDLLRKLEIKDTQIYNLYDVLEGQQTDELTELDVENLTQQVRAEEDKTEPGKKAKKVTIRSFVDEDEDSIEVGRGATEKLEDGETQELPWEGFEDEADLSYGALEGWRTSVH